MENESGVIAVVELDGYMLVSAVRSPEGPAVMTSPYVDWEDECMRPVREAVEGLEPIEHGETDDPRFIGGYFEYTLYGKPQ
ncbi:hypothetical protein GCM10009836_52200 [Pseudonocardia ailaonensis]|uniref:Uncharacterized protein n=1 Tax=Pseudonocardia ailaonensis TaxID=367279 RepID=A0ABN2NGI0_9PSEU